MIEIMPEDLDTGESRYEWFIKRKYPSVKEILQILKDKQFTVGEAEEILKTASNVIKATTPITEDTLDTYDTYKFYF